MATPELKARYGPGNTRALINRAIRAELVGGDRCLDALNALDQLRQLWIRRGWTEGVGHLDAALAHTHAFARLLRAEVRRRYGLPPEED